MNKYLTFVAFALCLCLGAYSSWHTVTSMPGYHSAARTAAMR